MTPALDVARRNGIAHTVHEYEHDPASASFGLEAVEKMGAPADQVFKTLVVQLDGKELAVAVIPVSSMMSLKSMAKTAGPLWTRQR